MAADLAKNKFLAPALLVLLPLLAYLPVFNAGFIWDDDVLITDNPVMKIPGGLAMIWRGEGVPDYFPLPYSMFWAEWRAFEYFAPGYHIVNVILHLIGTVILWRVLVRLKMPGAWFAALIFGIHPVCVASVAWIAEAKNTLSLIFFALAFLFYLRSEESSSRSAEISLRDGENSLRNEKETDLKSEISDFKSLQESTWSKRFYRLSFASFLLALLSKSSVVAFPIFLLGYAWWKRQKITSADLRRTIPFFLLSLIAGVTTIWFQKYRAGAADVPLSIGFAERLVGASWALWFYFFKAVWPVNLTVMYPTPKLDASSLTSWLPFIALLVVIVFNFKFNRRSGRSVLLAFAFFVLMLFPILGFVDVYFFRFSRVADHWNYLAIIGVIVLTVESARHFLGRSKIAPAIGAIVLVALFALTWQQAGIYYRAETYWRDAIKRNPGAWAAYGNLASALADQKKFDDAIQAFRDSLRLKPDFGNAHFRLAGLLAMEGKLPEALPHFAEAARLNPKQSSAHYDYGLCLERLGKTKEAESEYVEALRLNPSDANAHNNLGVLLLKQELLDTAAMHLNEAVRLQPDFAVAHANLGRVMAKEGKIDNAIAQFSTAIKIQPGYLPGYVTFAELLAKTGQRNQAVALLNQALQIKPDYAPAREALETLKR